VLEAIKDKNDLMTKLNHYLGPVIKHAYPAGHSPTQMLGKFLVDLALGDGAPIAGNDVLSEGRIIPNRAVRRIALGEK